MFWWIAQGERKRKTRFRILTYQVESGQRPELDQARIVTKGHQHLPGLSFVYRRIGRKLPQVGLCLQRGIEERPHLLIVVRQLPVPDPQLVERKLRLELKTIRYAISKGETLPPERPVSAQHVSESTELFCQLVLRVSHAIEHLHVGRVRGEIRLLGLNRGSHHPFIGLSIVIEAHKTYYQTKHGHPRNQQKWKVVAAVEGAVAKVWLRQGVHTLHMGDVEKY